MSGRNRGVNGCGERGEAANGDGDLLKALIRVSPVGIAILDPGGKVRTWNRAAERIFGWDEDEVRGRPLPFLSEDAKDALCAAWGNVADGDGFSGVDVRRTRKDGLGIDVSVSAAPLRGAAGEVLAVIVIVADVTERRRASEELRQASQRFRALVEASPLAIIVLDSDGKVQMWNRAAARTFGWTEEEVIGRAHPIVPEDKEEEFLASHRASMQGKTLTRWEVRRRRKDGTLIDIALSTAPLLDAEGRYSCVMGIISDISEQKRAEEALRISSETLSTLINASPLAIVTFDPGGNIEMWNPAAERMFGWSADEVRGRPHPIVPDEKQGEFRALRGIALRGETFTGMEARRRRKDGSDIDVSISTAPLRGAGGRITSIMSIIADITERKRTEEALRQSEEQLRQAQKMEAVGRLAGGIAHDFNNLLTAITGYSELLLGRIGGEDPMWREIEEIRRAGERAASLTRQLLAFSRRQVLQLKVLDLNAIVSNIDKMLRRLIGEDVDLVTVLGERTGRVKADPGQIEQVIMNLAVNARDAMPQGGRLTIGTADVDVDEEEARRLVTVEPGTYVVLTMSDTGCGMDDEVKSHLFEPFFTTKEEGTGLGLATIYGIVKQSYGHVRVDSGPGRGTTFRIFLPRVAEAGEPHEQARPAAGPSHGLETVLVVEDEDTVRELVCEILRRNGHNVLGARHGEDAVQIAERYGGRIHLMVTDVVMPGMSGNELAERLAPLRPEMKVLYMSGYTDNAFPYQGAEKVRDFIQKPFRPSVLSRKIREVLDSGKEGSRP